MDKNKNEDVTFSRMKEAAVGTKKEKFWTKKRYMNADEAAGYLNIKKSSLYTMAFKGRIRCLWLGDADIYFARQDLDAWIRKQSFLSNLKKKARDGGKTEYALNIDTDAKDVPAGKKCLSADKAAWYHRTELYFPHRTNHRPSHVTIRTLETKPYKAIRRNDSEKPLVYRKNPFPGLVAGIAEPELQAESRDNIPDRKSHA